MLRNSFKQLKYEDRIIICHLFRKGYNASAIAKQLCRSRSTITRELKRNRVNDKLYYPFMADRKMHQRRTRRRILEQNIPLRKEIIHRLKLTHSPQQIAETLRKIRGCSVISYETIYRFIYSLSSRDLKLWQHLRFNKRAYRRKQGIRHSKIKIPGRISIHQRPATINRRQVFGHWEGDLFHFQRGVKKNLLVLRERMTRFVIAIDNPDKSAVIIIEKLLTIFAKLPQAARQSITFDNDLAFALHEQLQSKLKIKTYFCDAYKSYQKGAVEQANLWLRERFPRTLQSADITTEAVKGWVKLMNNRPLKCLNYQTPNQCFQEQILLNSEEYLHG